MSKVVDGIVKDLKSIPEYLRKKIKETDMSRLVRMSVPYIIAGYVCDKAAWMYRQTTGEVFPRLLDTASRLGEAFSNPLPSFHMTEALIKGTAGLEREIV